MTISPGTRLGPYEITSPLGAGGMGEVYRARDTRLERSVAIKILPPELAGNAQFKIRFEREAKTISQLNHPNICTLYDVGDNYLVMELLEGETLADRLAKGPLSIDDVLRYGIQIALALDKAHKSGIVHRDLKPGNVILTKSGAKLLDFGLAKDQGSGAGRQPSELLTQHKPLTQEGTVLGTYQYMSPEQIAGEEADARSDIFSFGAVLYEMLTGKRAFDGKTRTSIVAAIVASEPRPAAQLQPLTPPALEHVIAKCLAKEPDARWQSAADIAGQLEWIGGLPAMETIAARRRPRVSIAMIGLALIAAAATGMSVWFGWRLQIAERPMTAELTFATATPLMPNSSGAIALSPDATRIAVLLGSGGATAAIQSSLAVRDLASGHLRLLAGTEGARFPFWSPDGKRLGFFAEGKLKTISADGGPIDVLCDAQNGRGGSWSREGVIVFAPLPWGPLFKVDQSGGTPVAVTTADRTISDRNPMFLRDGLTFLFTCRNFTQIPIGAPSGGALCAGFLDGRPARRIVENASNGAVVGDHLFFVRNRNLVIQAFDSKTLSTGGMPFDIAENVDYRNGFDLGNFSVAGNTVAYVPATTRRAQIGIFDSTGRLLDVKGQPADYAVLDVSPDGKNVAVRVTDSSGSDVWILQLQRNVLSRVTLNNSGTTAAFASDGKRIATSTLQKASIQALDGSSAEEVFDSRGLFGVSGWSADGKDLTDTFNVAYVDLQQHKLVPIIKTPAPSSSSSLSPNGKWLAYASIETGTSEVYITEFPTGRGKWRASINGGSLPRWSPGGKQLFFVRAGSLSAVDVDENNGLQLGAPKAIPVSVPQSGLAPLPNYAVSRDGKIITLANVTQDAPSAVHIITNWSKLLPR